MGNRSKAKGTTWETAVVNWLVKGDAHGRYKDARRNVLNGTEDLGDIDPVPRDEPPIIISAKTGYGGKTCPSCKHVREVHQQTKLWEEWWWDLHQSRRRRNPEALALLTLHRAGKASPEFAHWYVSADQLGGPASGLRLGMGPVKITGEQAVALMRRYAAPDRPIPVITEPRVTLT